MRSIGTDVDPDDQARPRASAGRWQTPLSGARATAIPGLRQIAIYALLLGVPLLVFNQQWLAFAVLAGIWSIAALGLGLILGYGGQISLGHAGLVAAGGYTAGILARDLGWTQGLSVVAAVVMAVALAAATVPILRLRGYYLALATLALAIIIERLLATWGSLTGGPSGLTGVPPLRLGSLEVVSNERWWVITVIAVAGCQLLIRRTVSGKTGRAIAVLHEDEDLMPSLRMDATRLKARLFLIGSGMAGLSGALLAHRIGFLSPEQFGVETSILLALVVLLGGSTSWWGPVIGMVLLRIIPELSTVNTHLAGVLIPIMVIAAVFAAPGGIASLVSSTAGLVTRRWSGRFPGGLAPSGVHDVPELASRSVGQVPTLEVRSVSKSFGGVQVLSDVSFTVRPGEVVGLIGPNGAGKTTLLNMVAGQLRPDSGEVVYKGASVGQLRPLDHKRERMVRTFQTPRLIGRLNVLDNVSAGADSVKGGEAAAASAVELSRLGRLDLSRVVPSSLPFGDMRATELARGLAMQPDLLLLDEPAAGLGPDDLDVLEDMLQQCASAGMSVILVEHNMEFLAKAVTRIVALANGLVVAEGKPEAVLSDDAVVEHYLGAAR